MEINTEEYQFYYNFKPRIFLQSLSLQFEAHCFKDWRRYYWVLYPYELFPFNANIIMQTAFDADNSKLGIQENIFHSLIFVLLSKLE